MDNKYTKLINKIIITLLSIFLIISISVDIYRNLYLSEMESTDIYCKSTYYDGVLKISLTTKIDIKNLEYYIKFDGSEKKNIYTKELAKASEPIEHIFYESEIKTLYLNNKEYKGFSWGTTNGKIKNKYYKKERPHSIPYNNECSFVYGMSVKTYNKTYQGMPYSYEDIDMYCTITNNSHKTILSIQNCRMEVNFVDNMKGSIYWERIDLPEPLKPNESIRIHLDDYTHQIDNLSLKRIKSNYNNYVQSTGYKNTIYSLVYQK